MKFCFTVVNSAALKTINNARVFFRKGVFKMKMVLTIFDRDLRITFNLQYGKVLSVAFSSRFLISNDFLQRNRKILILFFRLFALFGRFFFCYATKIPSKH